jgi:hypothetical protein
MLAIRRLKLELRAGARRRVVGRVEELAFFFGAALTAGAAFSAEASFFTASEASSDSAKPAASIGASKDKRIRREVEVSKSFGSVKGVVPPGKPL